jgi:hypothetical protein
MEFDIVDLEKNIQKEVRDSIKNEGIVIYEELVTMSRSCGRNAFHFKRQKPHYAEEGA